MLWSLAGGRALKRAMAPGLIGPMNRIGIGSPIPHAGVPNAKKNAGSRNRHKDHPEAVGPATKTRPGVQCWVQYHAPGLFAISCRDQVGSGGLEAFGAQFQSSFALRRKLELAIDFIERLAVVRKRERN